MKNDVIYGILSVVSNSHDSNGKFRHDLLISQLSPAAHHHVSACSQRSTPQQFHAASKFPSGFALALLSSLWVPSSAALTQNPPRSVCVCAMPGKRTICI